MASKESTHSADRAMMFECQFIFRLMKFLWDSGFILEVSKPLVDSNGYDLILECNGVIRHVQLKVMKKGGSTPHWDIHCALAAKPSGCVIVLSDGAEEEFRWLGGLPQEPLPDLGDKKAIHAKANAQGDKKERPNQRRVGKGKFCRCRGIREIAENLFGKIPENEGRG